MNSFTKTPTESVPFHPKRLQSFLLGKVDPGDNGNSSSELPKWLDKNLFNKGREFCLRYAFCLFFSQILGLMAIFSIPSIIFPLMYTKNSDTPSKAMRRYFSTVIHVITWYQHDVWDFNSQGHLDLLKVRSLHKRISQQLKEHPKKFPNDMDNLETDFECPLLSDLLREDLMWVKTKKHKGIISAEERSDEYLNQFDMMLTQYAFVGLVFSHPRMVGLWWVSEEEERSFAHFWRGIGWLLGMDDRYNLCSGSVEEIRDLCLEIESEVLLVTLSEASRSFDKMSEALMRGINFVIPFVSYPAMLLYLASAINLDVPSLRRGIKWSNYLQYLLMNFVFGFVFLVPGFISCFNCLINLALDKVKTRKIFRSST